MDHDFGIFLQRAAVLAEELEICYREKQKRPRHEVSALESLGTVSTMIAVNLFAIC